MTNSELKKVAEELVGEVELARRFRNWITNLIRISRMKHDNIDSGTLYDQDALLILADLNKRTGSRFGATDSAKALIVGRLKQGYQVADFYRVHEAKCAQWTGNAQMEHNLRPSTLYRQSHFDEYLAEWYKLDKQRSELAEKRKKARAATSGSQCPDNAQKVKLAEREAIISELMDRAWNEHASWLELMRWTMRFPDAESLAAYEMPERVRRMRQEPGMMLAVAKGKVPERAERYYQEIKGEWE